MVPMGTSMRSVFIRLCGVLILTTGLLSSSFPVFAGGVLTWYVAPTGTNSPTCGSSAAAPCATIAYTLGKAGPGDSIQLAAGTYSEHDLVINRAQTITGPVVPDGAMPTAIIDAGSAGRVITIGAIYGSDQITLQYLVIQNGSLTSEFGGQGGGIYCSTNYNLSLMNVVIRNNSVYGTNFGSKGNTRGGGIYSSGCIVGISNSLIQGNHSDGWGGGLYSAGILTVTNSTIRDNTAPGNAGGGLAIGAGSGTVYLSANTISGNSASYGGGIFSNVGHTGTFILEKTTVSGNQANTGAGIHLYGNLTITASTLSGNQAGLYGGGLFLTSGSTYADVNADHVTLVGNSANMGNDIFACTGQGSDCGMLGASSRITAHNSILASHTGGKACVAEAGASFPLTSGGYNLGSDNSCNLVGAHDQASTNPVLGPLQDNGGPTLTQALLPGSPAINQGDPASSIMTDQRGQPKNGTPDIGAFEVIQPPQLSFTTQVADFQVGQETPLYISLENPNGPPSILSSLAFTLQLSPGLRVSTWQIPDQPNLCGGTLAAVPGSSQITFSGGKLDLEQNPYAGCFMMVTLKAVAAGDATVTSLEVTAKESGGGTALPFTQPIDKTRLFIPMLRR